MFYDTAGKMNSITVSLVPFCLGLKLSKKFNQFPKLHVYPLFKSSIFVLLGNHLTDGLRGKKCVFYIYPEGCGLSQGQN